MTNILLEQYSGEISLNNTLEGTFSTSEIPPIPPCFIGLEEQWIDLNKNGRDFEKKSGSRHIFIVQKEKITPLEHLANFFRRALQSNAEDQEEDPDDEDFNYQESESCILTDDKHHRRNPSTNNFKQNALRVMNNLSKRQKAYVIRALIDISCATPSQLTSHMFLQVKVSVGLKSFI
ncbi:8973_t:CDS:2 [Funneliformis mosseae]|uniref:8973_t:CDS:1 n=1 Tax=Funneliformis mosseae TaxID=27381 RepID=A0A9N9GK53_FUNMO|nr:8973_t:CDS:2 [Funneliformis mosseae]